MKNYRKLICTDFLLALFPSNDCNYSSFTLLSEWSFCGSCRKRNKKQKLKFIIFQSLRFSTASRKASQNVHMTGCIVQFRTLSLVRSKVQLECGLANPLEKSLVDYKKSKSPQVCCSSDMQIASDFFLVKTGEIIFKYGKTGNFCNMAFQNYLGIPHWWRSIGSSLWLSWKRLENIEQPWIYLIKSNVRQCNWQTVNKTIVW